jgi:hypothetical protein
VRFEYSLDVNKYIRSKAAAPRRQIRKYRFNFEILTGDFVVCIVVSTVKDADEEVFLYFFCLNFVKALRPGIPVRNFYIWTGN